MTTETRNTANTEFSLPTVKADPVEYIVLERCVNGSVLWSDWFAEYNKASKEPGDRWQDVLGKQFEPYYVHVKACDQCRTFEIAWRVNPKDLPVETVEEK